MGSTLFKDLQARSSALAARTLETLQPRVFWCLSRVAIDPFDSEYLTIIYYESIANFSIITIRNN